MADNEPISAAAIGFKAFAVAFDDLVDRLIKKGINPSESCSIAKELSAQFLTFTNNSKLVENHNGPIEVEFVSDDE